MPQVFMIGAVTKASQSLHTAWVAWVSQWNPAAPLMVELFLVIVDCSGKSSTANSLGLWGSSQRW